MDPEADIRFSEESLHYIIQRYTREAGVRNLERAIGGVCRKQARRIAGGNRQKVEVTPALIEELLGAPRFRTELEVSERTRRPGVTVRLALTPVGGDRLFVKAGYVSGGSKGLIMTGNWVP